MILNRINAVIILILFPFLLFAQDINDKEIEILLSEPDRPGILNVDHVKGSINVSAYDGALVIVTASFRQKDIQNPKEIQIEAQENNNTVTVTTNIHSSTIDLDILVPRNFSLKLRTYHNGIITVKNVTGEMEISNINGDIILREVSGSALLNTIDGNITAVFNEVLPDLPMAFTTIYGNVDITFPQDINATVKMKSEYGETSCDFAMRIEKKRSSRNTGSARYVEEWIYGNINEGGAEILIKSFDGNISIKKR
ncbi:MAG: DUF4097 domain-containing protein [bacterium]|nr:DUF4097 domain-containing protein [bacterium]